MRLYKNERTGIFAQITLSSNHPPQILFLKQFWQQPTRNKGINIHYSKAGSRKGYFLSTRATRQHGNSYGRLHEVLTQGSHQGRTSLCFKD